MESFADDDERQAQCCETTGQTRAQDLRWTELDEGCLASCQFQVPDGPSMETFMVQVKVT